MPEIRTERLVLRPLVLEDCPRVRELAGHPEVSRYTEAIPHPYPDGAAAKWIVPQAELFEARRGVVFGIVEDGALAGAVSLESMYERSLELGYWLGVPFWGRGIMTEAVAAILPFGFEHFDIDRIRARAMSNNPASVRVLEKNGFVETESRTKGVRHFEGLPATG